VRYSDLSLKRYPVGGSVAARVRCSTVTNAPMFAAPTALAIQATGWDSASHVAKGNTPRPLELPGGSTG
jgi:hypothetical protein